MYRISVELLMDKSTAYQIGLHKMNLPEVCINAIKDEISRQNDICELISSINPYDEIRQLRTELIQLREEKLLEPRQQQKKKLLARITGGVR